MIRRYFVMGSIVMLGLVSAAACDNSTSSTLGGGGTGNSSSTTTPGNGGSGAGTTMTTANGEIDQNCSAYCNRVLEDCGPGNEQYADLADCEAACELWPEGRETDTSGPSLGCRTGYLAFADDSEDDEITHCRNGGPFSERCGEHCYNFCLIAQTACDTEQTRQWENEQDCREDCEDWRSDGLYYTGSMGDTFECRAVYAAMAIDNPNQNCQHLNETELCEDPPMGMGGMGGMGGMMPGGMGGMPGGMGGMPGGMGGMPGGGGSGGN